MKPRLQCAEQQVSGSNLTKYWACHAERLTYLIIITYETSFTMRGATGVTIQPHQILRLSRRKTHILSPHHLWNVIYSARSNRCHDPTSPNTAPATKNDIARFQRKSPKTGETSFPMRGRSDHDPSMIREWKRKPQPASQVRLLCEVPRSIFYCKIQRFAPNLTVKLSPNTAPATKSDTTTSPSTAPATKSATWTSPSTAPATKNDSTALSSSHMKRHFQCAEQQVSLSNLAKYCACHEKWHCKMSKKISKNRWNVISNAGPIRPWSDHDPSMIRAWSENENANRNPPRKWGYFARSPEAFSIVKYNVLHPILQSNFHQILRLPRKVTLQLHQVLRLPRKVPLERHQVLHLPRKMTRLLYRPHIWNVISNARSNRCHYPTSPNTAPATKNDTARCQRKSPKTGETSFPMRGRSDHDPSMIREWKRKPQPASQVRLLCEVPRSIFYCKIQCFAPNLTVKLSPNTAPATKSDTTTSPSTAPATKSATWTSPSTAPATKSDTWTSPSSAPATKSDTWTSPSTAPATSRSMTPTLLDSTRHYSTWLNTWLYSTRHYSTWLYSTWLYSTRHYSTWLYSTWLYSTWLYVTLLYLTLLYSTLLYLTKYLTLLYSTLLYLTLLYLTLLYLTLRDSTLLDSTLLDTTLLD